MSTNNTNSVYRPVRIILADDHEIFRDGFNSFLQHREDIQLIGEASNGEQLVRQVSTLVPDVVLTDIKMPVMNGIQATKIISEKHPEVGIIALTMFGEEGMIINMLEAGAMGYVLKSADKKEIAEAIHTVAKHLPYYCSTTNNKLAQLIAHSRFNPNDQSVKPRFTNKEKVIVCLICDGFTTREIAAKLHLSIRTIEAYREKILEKTNSKNTAGIVMFAVTEGVYIRDINKI